MNLKEPTPGEILNRPDFASIVRLTPLVSIDLVLRCSDGRYLVGRRKHEPARGFLFVPGGRITKNETRAAAFRRLTKQELGVVYELSQARFLGVFDHFYPTNRLEESGYGTHYVALGYGLNLSHPPGQLPREQHSDYLSLTAEELLENPEVHENTKAYVRLEQKGIL